MILTGPGCVAILVAAIVAVIWRLNEWHDQHRAALTPDERQAEDARDAN